MSSADLWEDGYPHGTVEGFDNGCRGGACPADTDIGMSCKRAKALAAGDFRYNRLVAAGKTPAEIAAIIDGRDTPTEAPAPKPAPKRKPKAPAPADVEAAAPITETPAEVSLAGPPTTATTSAGPTELTESTIPTPEEDAMPAQLLTTEKFTAGLNQRGRTFVLRSIREWARANGFPGVPSHGRIPQDALAAFDQAHPNGIIGPEAPAPAAGVDAHVKTLRDITDWARQNGHPDLSMLDITDEIREAYDAAHAEPTEPGTADAEPPADTPEDTAQEPAGGFLPEVPTPQVGMRAWVRFDDGVAVVREVALDAGGFATHVRVTFLPNVRDEESWASIDWLDHVSDALPVDVFTYDHFPEDDRDDSVAAQLAQWESEGRTYRAGQLRPFSADLGDVRDRAGIPLADGGIIVNGAVSFDEVDTPETYVPTPKPSPRWIAGKAISPRPDWSQITVNEDVERARELAVRLEAENALLLEQVAAAHRALEVVLVLHAERRDDNAALRQALGDAETQIAYLTYSAGIDAGHERLLRARIAELEAAAAKPWWKRTA
ncbi:MAG: hypothetical protein PIR02_16065 [Microbacterium enclense]